MVAPEMVGEHNYFGYRGQVIQISEQMLRDGVAYDELIPLQINFDKLRKLGFTVIPASSGGKWLKASADGKNTVYLTAGTGNCWIIQINGHSEQIRKVIYVHELQNFWFWFFEEVLQKKAVKQPYQGERKPNSVIARGKPIKLKDGANRNTIGYEKTLPQPFYLTWDCMYCISSSPLCVWGLRDGPPLFAYEGEVWSFTWLLGQADNIIEQKALEWFKAQLPTLQVYGSIR